VGRVWTNPGGAIERPARANPSRSLSSETITKSLDPEKRWEATTIGNRAVGTVLNQIWEEDFRGFSYGFRPGRSQHDALDALWVGIARKKVNWVLDLDIRAFFDRIEHSWMIKFVEHRIGDRRIVRLIQKWLKGA